MDELNDLLVLCGGIATITFIWYLPEILVWMSGCDSSAEYEEDDEEEEEEEPKFKGILDGYNPRADKP